MFVTESKRITVVFNIETVEASVDMLLMFREATSSAQAVTKLS